MLRLDKRIDPTINDDSFDFFAASTCIGERNVTDSIAALKYKREETF